MRIAYGDITKGAPSKEFDLNLASIPELKPYLCGKTYGDPYVCIDCPAPCKFGKRAVELLEEETKAISSSMTKKKRYAKTRQIDAMQAYLAALKAPDPAQYVMKEYNLPTIQKARQKLHSWKHVYGANANMIEGKINLLKIEIGQNLNAVKPEKTEKKAFPVPIIDRTVPSTKDPAAYTARKEEESAVKDALTKKRLAMEDEITHLDEEIIKYKAAIEFAEKKIADYTNQIQAIRLVQDMFNRKE